jgi:hypothetical protein
MIRITLALEGVKDTPTPSQSDNLYRLCHVCHHPKSPFPDSTPSPRIDRLQFTCLGQQTLAVRRRRRHILFHDTRGPPSRVAFLCRIQTASFTIRGWSRRRTVAPLPVYIYHIIRDYIYPSFVTILLSPFTVCLVLYLSRQITPAPPTRHRPDHHKRNHIPPCIARQFRSRCRKRDETRTGRDTGGSSGCRRVQS